MDAPEIVTDPAFPLLTLDVVSNVLRHASNPGELSDFLTSELRELTGSRTVVIVQSRLEAFYQGVRKIGNKTNGID